MTIYGFIAIGTSVIGVIILLDILVIEIRYELERRRFAKMKPQERNEYLLKKYGKNGLDYYEELTEHKS